MSRLTIATKEFLKSLKNTSLTPAQLEFKYMALGDGEYFYLPQSFWIDEVTSGNTVLGYWEWVAQAIAKNNDSIPE